MIFSGFDVGKLVRGFNIFNGAVLGKIIWYLVLTSIVLAIFWRAFIKQDAPVDQSSQQAETITNITEVKEEAKTIIGIEILGHKIGWRF